jgi:hypothetical protein
VSEDAVSDLEWERRGSVDGRHGYKDEEGGDAPLCCRRVMDDGPEWPWA